MIDSTTQASNDAGQEQRPQRVVVRNVLFLVVAQLVGAPLSLAVNAVMARRLGPEDFGLLYLAMTFVSFGFLAVDWGQNFTLPSLVARNRSRAGELLGSGLVWRVVSAVAVYLLLALAAHILGYSQEFQVVLAFVVLTTTMTMVALGCQDAVRGFERTDVAAYGTMAAQLGAALLVVPTLLLGGKLRAALLAQSVSLAIVVAFVWRATRRIVGPLAFRFKTTKELVVEGYSFLFFGLAMTLQPNIDGIFLSKLAPPDTVGWYAASRKLVGIVIFPASALIGSLYPTLCRLYAEDQEGFRRTSTASLRLVTILVVPVGLACALYPEVGVQLFSRESFGPAADDLRVLSVFVLLVYFTMILGSCIMAAGRQRAWAGTQFLCVGVSLALDPLLVPWFQRRTGNGGLGLCVTSVASEVLMLVSGIWLLPRGILDRSLRRELFLALAAGAVAVVAARLMSGFSPFVAGPIALLFYGAALFMTGAVDKEQLQTLRSLLRRKSRS